MSDVLERVPVIKNKSQTEPPKKWKVVLHNPIQGCIVDCDYTILREVFRKSDREAYEKALEASLNGRSVVYEAFHDAAESKTQEANQARDDHARHKRLASILKFTCEKADP